MEDSEKIENSFVPEPQTLGSAIDYNWKAHNHDGVNTPKISSGYEGIRVYLNTPTAIPNAEATKVPFDAESWDTGGEFTSSRYTAKKEGKYFVSANVGWKADTVDQGAYHLYIYKNGAEQSLSLVRASGTYGFSQNVTDVVSLSVGDYIEIYVFIGQNNQSILSESYKTYLLIHKID